jgi:hypothetical protein
MSTELALTIDLAGSSTLRVSSTLQTRAFQPLTAIVLAVIHHFSDHPTKINEVGILFLHRFKLHELLDLI